MMNSKNTQFKLTPAFCAENGVVITENAVSQEGFESVTVGYTEQSAKDILAKIEKSFYSRRNKAEAFISFIKIQQEDFSRYLAKLYASQGMTASSENKAQIQDEQSEAPIINLLNSLLLEGIARKASDIHLEPSKENYCIRLRIDGDLVTYSEISDQVAQALLSRIKLLSDLQIVEKRRGQDGKFIFAEGNRSIEVRVSVIPAWNGESAVLRILDTQAVPLSLAELGFCDTHINMLNDICKLRNSLILICGPTGAGKTTTLAALLTLIADSRTKVVSIEDPVEYRIPGVIQFPVNTSIDMDFDDILRRVFRHDPDVIMIGEIRDEKTAGTAVRAALTGHLVFATIHAVDAAGGILRLLDMGIEPYLLASVFGASIAQRLVKRPGGGRRVAAEILISDDSVTEAIRNKATLAEIDHCLDLQQGIRLQDDIERRI